VDTTRTGAPVSSQRLPKAGASTALRARETSKTCWVSQRAISGSGKVKVVKWEALMKKISIILALAFAFTTGMAVVTVVAHTDEAAAAVIYPHVHPGLLIAKS
jgi:phosphohistidine phosphatase SixA